MRTKSTAPLSPGVYTIAGRGYLVAPDGAVRSVRPSGRTGRSVVARVTPGGLQVTGNGTEGGHTGNLLALADGCGAQVEVHCRRCGRAISEQVSLAVGLGPECRKAVA